MPASAAASKVDDHGRPNHEPELVAAEPEIDDRAEHDGKQQAIEQPDGGFAADDAERIRRAEILRGERAHGDGHGLRAALPPMEATMGIRTASATNCSMVASNRLMTTTASNAVPDWRAAR